MILTKHVHICKDIEKRLEEYKIPIVIFLGVTVYNIYMVCIPPVQILYD